MKNFQNDCCLILEALYATFQNTQAQKRTAIFWGSKSVILDHFYWLAVFLLAKKKCLIPIVAQEALQLEEMMSEDTGEIEVEVEAHLVEVEAEVEREVEEGAGAAVQAHREMEQG